MKQRYFSTFVFFFFIACTDCYAQSDTHSLKEEWGKLKAELIKRNSLITDLISNPKIESKFSEAVKVIHTTAKSYNDTLIKITIIDSIRLVQIQDLEFSLLIMMAELGDKIQQQHLFENDSQIKTAAKNVDHAVSQVIKQAHDFNYWINEQQKLNLIFTTDL